MKRDLQFKILKELLSQIDEGRNVDAGLQYRMPVDAYTCPEIAEREWNEFFGKMPQLIGLSGRLPENGSFFAVDDFGVPVLATRGKDGVFRAFLNICRHRAVRLVSEEAGRASKFTCPFHAWTYSNEGDLIAVPQEKDFGAVDKPCMGLTPLPAEERHGMLWVHPQPDGVLDLESHLGPVLDEVSDHGYQDLVYIGQSVIEKNLNWKLANDTFGETYHFSRLHKDTLANIFVGDHLAYEELGLHHRFVFAVSAINALRDKPESEWGLAGYTNLLYYIFPNVQFAHGAGFSSLVKMYPIPGNPGRSLTRIDHYSSAENIAAVRAAEAQGSELLSSENAYSTEQFQKVPTGLSALTEIFESTVAQEDYLMGEQQQKNAESGAVKELLFGHNEAPLHHYHNTFRKVLGMPPLERVR